MSAARKLRFGVIGVGTIGATHAEALLGAEHAELAAVCDTSRERATAFAAKFGCRAAASLDELLADPGIDAVSIATPSGLHAECAIPAAQAGKHILCEKPLEITVERCDAILKAAEAAGVTLACVFNNRFFDASRAAKAAILAGRFGDPVLVSAAVRWHRDPEYYRSAWRGTWALDGGGALMNQGIHAADLLRFFNGDVVEVMGFAGRRAHPAIEVEDTLSAVLKFANGSMGCIETSTACAPGFARRIEFSGNRGSFILVDDRLERWEPGDARPEDDEIRRIGAAGHPVGGRGQGPAVDCEMHRRQFDDLALAVRDHRPPAVPGIEGRRTVAMVCAIYRSVRENRPATPEK